MKKIFMMTAGVLLCAILLAGCGTRQPEPETTAVIENDTAVLGTWMEDEFDSGYTFNSDGTGMLIFWQQPFTYTAIDGVLTITYEDTTYALEKDTYQVDESGSVLTISRQSDSGKTFTYRKR